ncbi:cytochrome P450 [Streptomyces iconiensis]|uniref:Cytochrome P450 n=1 Tax=Streptomyces iconiensis TaxID=1384038 RepID=A0ABT7A7K2_9ACTN|nr:cytochrome P450 [Streptomyces iconiensis]MDJ1137314.1 cytochrome P450 [Streptomyces iconiensis]
MNRRQQPPRLAGSGGGSAAWRRDRLAMAVRAAAECGDVWMLGPGAYVAATAGPCETVLRRTTHEYETPPGTFLPVKRADGSGPGPNERAHGHAARMRGLRPKVVAARIGEIAPGAAEFAEGWPVGQDVEVLPRARRVLVDIGARYLFSGDAEALRPLGAGLADAREALIRSWPLPPRVPTPARRCLARQQAAFAGALQAVIDRRRRTGELGNDLLGLMLCPSTQYGLLPDAAIIDSLTGLIVATAETPTRAVGWLLLALARETQAADRIAVEAARTLPGDPHTVTGAHLDGLRYTQAFVREVLRLHPPNWLLARRATTQTRLGGYPVDPGTTVLVCPYTAQRDAHEHPAPDRFSPERWLEAGGSLRVPGVFLPFGTGPRGCEGTAMALAILTLLTAETARRHHLSEPPGPEPSHRVTTFGALTPNDLRLRATPRD